MIYTFSDTSSFGTSGGFGTPAAPVASGGIFGGTATPTAAATTGGGLFGGGGTFGQTTQQPNTAGAGFSESILLG